MGRLRKDTLDKIRANLEAGFTDVEVAAKAKVAAHTVAKYRRLWGSTKSEPSQVKVEADGYSLSRSQLHRVDIIDHLEGGRGRSSVVEGLLGRDSRFRKLLDDPEHLKPIIGYIEGALRSTTPEGLLAFHEKVGPLLTSHDLKTIENAMMFLETMRLRGWDEERRSQFVRSPFAMKLANLTTEQYDGLTSVWNYTARNGLTLEQLQNQFAENLRIRNTFAKWRRGEISDAQIWDVVR